MCRLLLAHAALGHQRVQIHHVVCQRTLAGTADARQAGEHAQRNIYVQFLQVVPGSAGNLQKLSGLAPLLRNGDAPPAGQERPRQGFRHLRNTVRSAGIH